MPALDDQERRARLDRQRGCICLQPIPGGDHFYEIDIAQCRTPEAAAEWIRHLLDKTWGFEILPDFLRVLMGMERRWKARAS